MFRYITSNGISAVEVDYWKRMAKANLKVGVEIECQYSGRGYSNGLNNEFNPTNDFGNFGKFGVLNVHPDGSLMGGTELCTIGRRLSFIDLYEQYKYIVSKMMDYMPYISERASLHNHILFDYNGNISSLEKPMPDIVMKNFLQLIKKYGAALIWITSTLKTSQEGVITRYSYYCEHKGLYEMAVPSKSMVDIISVMCQNRYRMVNFKNMYGATTEDGLKKFHLELRFPDCSIFPAQIAAQNILYGALVIKAIELSECGIIAASDSEEDWRETKRLMYKIRDGEDRGFSANRVSTPLAEEDTDKVRQRAVDMVKELKPEICFVDKNAYMVLSFLAQTPISKSEHDYNTDPSKIQTINNEYDLLVSNMYSHYIEDEGYSDIINAVNSMSIKGITEAQWLFNASQTLSKNQSEIKSKIESLKMYRKLMFDIELQTYVFN